MVFFLSSTKYVFGIQVHGFIKILLVGIYKLELTEMSEMWISWKYWEKMLWIFYKKGVKKKANCLQIDNLPYLVKDSEYYF